MRREPRVYECALPRHVRHLQGSAAAAALRCLSLRPQHVAGVL